MRLHYRTSAGVRTNFLGGCDRARVRPGGPPRYNRTVHAESGSLIAERLRTALELYDLGLTVMRQNLRRRFPTDDDAAIERRLVDWRLQRQDAPDGDCPGRLVPVPRQPSKPSS